MVSFKDIEWKLPDRFEYFLFALATIFFAIFDYAQNKYQALGMHYWDKSFLGFSLISVFWTFLFLYVMVALIGIVRSLLRRGTYFGWDFTVGLIMLLGVYFIAAGGIAAIYYKEAEIIPWFFGMPQLTMYHIFGVFAQILGGIWFFITD